MGWVCRIWAPIYYSSVMVNNPNNFMRFFFSLSILSIWARHFPIFDKSKWQTSTDYFSKVDPLQLLKLWKRALWLAEKWSHGQFWGLSLVKSTVCLFSYPLMSRGVCHIWGLSQIWQIPPIFDKPLYSQLGSEKRKLCSRPMRGLQIDHVTSFRPITRLDFIILKVVRGPPYWNLR